MSNRQNKKSVQRGVGLLEVLIAIVLLAVGILGLASMQISAKRLNADALQRSIATELAHDIIERMRSNPDQLAAYVGTYGGESIGTAPTSCSSGACAPATLATRDVWEWEQALDGASETITEGGQTRSVGGLLTPRGCIVNAAGTVTVTIAWQGYESLSDLSANTCGADAGLYGTNDSQRQLLVVTTFIQGL